MPDKRSQQFHVKHEQHKRERIALMHVLLQIKLSWSVSVIHYSAKHIFIACFDSFNKVFPEIEFS